MMRVHPVLESHPILAGLKDYIARARRDGRVLLNGELEVVARGKPFIGIKRPKGFRQMARKSCFRNAAILATHAERAQYVEGFAGSKDCPIHHAWVTLDGVHAIDVTWDDATENEYFGIVFETRQVRKVLFERRLWTPMLGDGWRYRGKLKETRSASMTATRKIPLRLIAPLACKRPEIVGRYVAMLRAGQKPPPVALITQERGARYKYRISDGAHRVRAARRVGLKTIEARIIVTFG